MAALEPRVLRYFVSDREPLAAKRIGGALQELQDVSEGRLVVQRERRAANADFIWLNTPSKAHKAACRAASAVEGSSAHADRSTYGGKKTDHRGVAWRRCWGGS